MTSRIEDAIQRALVDYIKKQHKQMLAQATLNENSRHKVEMGLSVGITDLLIFLRKDNICHIFFHELKTKAKNSKLRDSQVNWYKNEYVPKLQASNTYYAVSKGLSEAKKEVDYFFSTVYST
jgi:hypothetical protein